MTITSFCELIFRRKIVAGPAAVIHMRYLSDAAFQHGLIKVSRLGLKILPSSNPSISSHLSTTAFTNSLKSGSDGD
jgi:hypothetical protein